MEAVVTIMNSYNLLREDFDNVIELSSWSDSKDVMSQVDSKVFIRIFHDLMNLMMTQLEVKVNLMFIIEFCFCIFESNVNDNVIVRELR